jgi:hypothetical protein
VTTNNAWLAYIGYTTNYFHGETITLLKHGGLVSSWQRLLSFQAMVLVVLVLWLLTFRIFADVVMPPLAADILLIISLMALWFPCRLYSDWYVGFQNFHNLQRNQSFVILILLTPIAAGVAYVLISREQWPKIVAVVAGTVSAGVTFYAKLKPGALAIAASAINKLNWKALISLELVVLLLIIAAVMKHQSNSEQPVSKKSS